MSIINILPKVVEECRMEYDMIVQRGYRTSIETNEVSDSQCKMEIGSLADKGLNQNNIEPIPGEKNLVFCGDNLEYICHLIREERMAGSIQMIYIDPPFFTMNDHGASLTIKTDKIQNVPILKQHAYQDKWGGDISQYFKMLCIRLMLMRDILKDEGSIFVHLDWHVVHHVKLLMDEIFGEENFVNEIIWHYKSGGVSKKYFARKHDNILYYSKSKHYYFKPQKEKSYNRGYKPYRFKGVSEYEDSLGWYTFVNRKDVWQLDMVGRSSGERVNYATQKPVSLVERMIESCTVEGDLCADFFCGSGTLAIAAHKNDRRFICCDSGKLAISNTTKRLLKAGAGFTLYASDYERGPKIKAELNLSEQIDLLGSKIATIKLTGYSNRENELVVKGHRDTIAAEIYEKDPIAFIDFWCVDTNYDGVVFRPAKVLIREGKNNISRSCDIILSGKGNMCIKAYDLFGNSMNAAIEYSIPDK